jgi:hypothetical protein
MVLLSIVISEEPVIIPRQIVARSIGFLIALADD